MISTKEFVAGFDAPNSLAVFIDDTGSPDGIQGTLVKNFVSYAAVVVRTERLRALVADHCEFLSRYPQAQEFHANEIRIGKKAWADSSPNERIAAFAFWRDCLLKYAEVIPYVYVGGEQFIKILKPQIDQKLAAGEIKQVDGWDWNSHKSIARRVFVTALRTWIPARISADGLIMIRDLKTKKTRVCKNSGSPALESTETVSFSSIQSNRRVCSLPTCCLSADAHPLHPRPSKGRQET
jgi:hypothetical protein